MSFMAVKVYHLFHHFSMSLRKQAVKVIIISSIDLI